MRRIPALAAITFSTLFLVGTTLPGFAASPSPTAQSEYPTSTNKRISNNNGYDIDRPVSPELEANDSLPESPSSYPSSANRRGTTQNNAYTPAPVTGHKLPQEDRTAGCTSEYPTSSNLRQSLNNGYDCSPN